MPDTRAYAILIPEGTQTQGARVRESGSSPGQESAPTMDVLLLLRVTGSCCTGLVSWVAVEERIHNSSEQLTLEHTEGRMYLLTPFSSSPKHCSLRINSPTLLGLKRVSATQDPAACSALGTRKTRDRWQAALGADGS